MPKLQESKGRFFITIPINLASQQGWVKGEDLVLIFNERGNIEISKSTKIKK